MMLIEPAATNLAPYSEDFSQWTTIGGGVTLTANYGISPDGTQNSTRLQFSGSSQQLSDNITTSSSSTGSVWVKGTSGETIRFGVYASENNFTLNGSWQRIQRQGTSTSNLITINTYGGVTARDLEIWGGQLEDGTVPTSYIPTSGSAVTRAADDLVIDGSDFSDFYNSSEGTFYVEAVFRQDNNGDGQSLLYGQSNNYRFLYGWDGAMRVYDGATIVSTSPTTLTVGNLTRTAVTFDSSTMGISLDGSSTVSGSHNGNLSSATELNIGNSSNYHLNGHIKRVIYWPYHSDNL
jgi:hypothetical protein